MPKELPKNLQALEGIGFEEIKKAANNLKTIKTIIDRAIEKNNLKLLEDAKNQADIGIKHLEEFTGVLNKEREVVVDVKTKAREIERES
ncbi:MAG: hypothetical protein PHH61_01315 [Candidatus Nanoarchaeia archaeon]|nr:hypothetical protein [Candidatus Nanoarchaeia archaeon]